MLYNLAMEVTVNSLEETQKLAEYIATCVDGQEIILLNGDLGAGKTTFTKYFAKALGIDEMVTSPTFAFMKEYYGKYKLSHYDMYRVESQDELWELGIMDNLEEVGICIIEWNKFTCFPDCKRVLTIDITKIGDDARQFHIKGL